MKSKYIILSLVFLFINDLFAQTFLSENMGSPSSTTTISNNIFQNNSLLFSNGLQTSSADIRITSSSTNYSEASGSGNVFFSAASGAYGFSIEGINAANNTNLNLQFGYKKESATNHASFAVEFWNGTNWLLLANTSATLFNESTSAAAVWYLSKTISLPVSAQINGLKLRFIKTGTTAIRIDDVKLSGVEVTPTVINTSVSSITTNSASFSGDVTSTGGATIIETGTVYSFTSVNNNPQIGGLGVSNVITSNPNSGTGTFSTITSSSLSPNVQYSYNAYAKKATGTKGYGSVSTFYTLAVAPAAPLITSIAATTVRIAVGTDSNATTTTYAIIENSTGKFVQADGSLNTTPVFRTRASWSTIKVVGLTPSTNYSFHLVAKNGAEVLTQNSVSSSFTTFPSPVVTLNGVLNPLNTVYGTSSSTTSFTIEATNLTDTIIVSAPVGFEISLTAATSYGSSVTLNQSTGIISLTTVYVRLASSTPFGNYTGNISIASQNDDLLSSLATASSSVSKLNVSISNITASSKFFDGTTTASLIGSPSLNGILTTDLISVQLNVVNAVANFQDATVGIAKSVTVSGYSLTGVSSNNYNLLQPSGLTADINSNNSSDVVFNSSSSTSSNTNIDYKLYQGTTLTSTGTGSNGSVGVMGFYLRDGGVNLNDADNLDTELTAITFTVNHPEAIRSARLFVGNSARGIPVTVNGSLITFTGLTNIKATDNNQLAVNLRVTFNSTVIDNQQLQFAVTSVSSNLAGSTFAVSNGGGATSSIVGDSNKVEVVADRLSFIQQPPTSVFTGTEMSPAPIVHSLDSNLNLDLDFSGLISIQSSGTLNNSAVSQNAINGIATFSSITHINPGTGLFLSASVSTILPADSALFDVTSLIVPSFNTVSAVCYGNSITDLPTTSLNGIVGTWSPALTNLATTTYTFTPSSGQNATTTTLTIVINQPVDPLFSTVGPIPAGATLQALPLVSTNGVLGSWSPALDNATTTTYTFTPVTGSCASSTTMTIVVMPVVTSLPAVINTIHQLSYKVPSTTSIVNGTPAQLVEQVTYYDGLGRQIQKKALKQSNTGKDIVFPIEYDLLSRNPKSYLPYVNSVSSINYEENALFDVLTFYNNREANFENTTNPYSQNTFESSPLNRVTKVSNPGNDWQTLATSADRTMKIDYQTNATNEVLILNAESNANSTVSLLANGNYYPQAELIKTIVKNENWKSSDVLINTTEEFKDKEGRVLLKRTYGTSMVDNLAVTENHDTYYVYDQYSNLAYVIPPKVNVTQTISQTILDNLAYQYRYDYRNRVVEKKVPGKEWEYILYDKLDRVVASGPSLSPFTDAVAPTNLGWKIIKYDVFNRVIATGWMEASGIDSSTRATLQTTLTNATQINETKIGSSYSNTVWPTTYDALTVNYYDDYNGSVSFTDSTLPFLSDGYNNSTLLPKGLPTLSWVRVLEAKTDNRAERTYIIYDKDGRTYSSFANNHLNGYTKIELQMQTITGRIDKTVAIHKKSSATTDAEIVITNVMTYSDQDRLISQTHQIGSGVVQLMNKNDYSELGELLSKKVGSKTPGDLTTGLQNIDYSYNARGWLKSINDVTDLKVATENDLFAYKINYNTVDNVNSTKQYNGNISETLWRTASDNTIKQYSYDYDEFNRLRTAVFSKPIAGTTSPINNSYGENAWYDKNGNITHLERYKDINTAPTNQIDDLVYDYYADSNQLKSVSDLQSNPEGFKDGNLSNDDFVYDTFGNLIIDKNKNIINPTDVSGAAIVYNHLQLPLKVSFGTNGMIEYLYTATGKKIQKKVTDGALVTVTEYLDGFQYQNNVLSFFATPEGYVQANGSYVFQYKDHLGNVRVSYTNINSTATIIEENSYYPFGMTINDTFYSPIDNKNQYNGKEYQDELSLNVVSMDFRNYDSTIGRFNVIDPLAEMEYSFTPYHFANDNPVLYSDPSGLKSVASEGTDSYVPNGGVLSMLMAGKNGLEIRDHLQEQMWGPNIILSSTGTGGGGTGGFGMRSIKPQGHFERRYAGSNINRISITETPTYFITISYKGNYDKVWISDEDSKAFDLINGAAGNFLFALDNYAVANKKFVYNYGTRAISATALTEANVARMLNISTSAQIIGNTLGIVTGIYTLSKTINKHVRTGEVDVKGYVDGVIGLTGGIAGSIVTFGLISNPVGLAVLGGVATGAAIWGIVSFGIDVYYANKE